MKLLNLGCFWSADPDMSSRFIATSLRSLSIHYPVLTPKSIWREIYIPDSSHFALVLHAIALQIPDYSLVDCYPRIYLQTSEAELTHRYCQYDIRALVNQYSSLAWVYLSSSVTVVFVCWTGRSLSRMSIENCSLFYWNESCLGHRMHCEERK